MEGLWQDVRYAMRKLVRQPGFTIAALLTLALGIGANVVLFTLINALLLRAPAGVTSPEKIVSISTEDYSSGKMGASSYADYLDFAKEKDVFASAAAYSPQVIASGSNESITRVGVELTTDTYVQVMGANVRGRWFNAAEAASGAPVAVVSEQYWRQQMGGAQDAIGRTVQLNAKPVTVIGIVQNGFRGALRGFATDVWMPFRAGERVGAGNVSFTNRGDRGVFVAARLNPGVTVPLARRKLDLVAARLYKEMPDSWGTLHESARRVGVESERASRIPGQFRSQAYAFTGMLAVIVALVLMICCANVAGLMIARATGLMREMGIRISIGASRTRIARLLIVESVVLSVGAAAIGLLATTWLMEIISRLLPRLPVPVSVDLGVDSRVILFASFLALFTAVVFGSAPAFRASRADPNLVIKAGNTPMSIGRRRISFRGALVGIQVASSVMLLVTALLFLRSMRTALSADLGFNIKNTALFELEPEPGYKPDDAEGTRVAMAVTEMLRGTKGVSNVTFVNDAPLSNGGNRRGTTIEGHTFSKGEDREFNFSMVGPSYLTTLGVPLVQGRDISAEDRKGSPAVLVVNESFANRFWKGQSAIGKRISIDGEHFAEIVGVARNAHLVAAGNSEIVPMMFFPMQQDGWWGTTLIARVDNASSTRIADLKTLIATNTPRWQVRGERTMLKQAESSILPQKIASMVLTGFGTLAMILSAIGLYGVIAYAVAQRTREFGIRMALGATTREVVQLMLNQGLRVILIGAAVGMVLTAGAAQVMKSLLLGLSPLDPVSFLVAPALLILIGSVATLLPARRAARVDPLNALRTE